MNLSRNLLPVLERLPRKDFETEHKIYNWICYKIREVACESKSKLGYYTGGLEEKRYLNNKTIID